MVGFRELWKASPCLPLSSVGSTASEKRTWLEVVCLVTSSSSVLRLGISCGLSLLEEKEKLNRYTSNWHKKELCTGLISTTGNFDKIISYTVVPCILNVLL